MTTLRNVMRSTVEFMMPVILFVAVAAFVGGVTFAPVAMAKAEAANHVQAFERARVERIQGLTAGECTGPAISWDRNVFNEHLNQATIELARPLIEAANRCGVKVAILHGYSNYGLYDPNTNGIGVYVTPYDDKWVTTLAHEMGHMVQYNTNLNGLDWQYSKYEWEQMAWNIAFAKGWAQDNAETKAYMEYALSTYRPVASTSESTAAAIGGGKR